MAPAHAIQVKARTVLKQLGHTEAEPNRQYKDWHIDIRGSGGYLSVWHSGRMVYLSLAGIPVYHVRGPWEQYLDLLWQRASR